MHIAKCSTQITNLAISRILWLKMDAWYFSLAFFSSFFYLLLSSNIFFHYYEWMLLANPWTLFEEKLVGKIFKHNPASLAKASFHIHMHTRMTREQIKTNSICLVTHRNVKVCINYWITDLHTKGEEQIYDWSATRALLLYSDVVVVFCRRRQDYHLKQFERKQLEWLNAHKGAHSFR